MLCLSHKWIVVFEVGYFKATENSVVVFVQCNIGLAKSEYPMISVFRNGSQH